MKKILAAALCLVLAFSIIGCEKRGGNLPDDVEHKINYELGDLADDFISTPVSARSGEIVEIRTHILYDADIHVYVDGKEIEKSHYDSDYWGYSFTMPQKVVSVTAKPYSKAEIWGE